MIFKRRDLIEYADALANYLPGGPLFAAKKIAGTKLNELMRGLASEHFRANALLRDYVEHIIPDKTVLFIDEWESAVGIPDDCFTGNGTVDVRRRDVLVKLASEGLQTADDYEALGAIFGIQVYANPGPLDFQITLNIVQPPEVVFALDYAIPFGTSNYNSLVCFYEKLKPAHCELVIQPALI